MLVRVVGRVTLNPAGSVTLTDRSGDTYIVVREAVVETGTEVTINITQRIETQNSFNNCFIAMSPD